MKTQLDVVCTSGATSHRLITRGTSAPIVDRNTSCNMHLNLKIASLPNGTNWCQMKNEECRLRVLLNKTLTAHQHPEGW